MHIIDLRSDTLTLPTAEILHSMQTAELGDDGLDKDSNGEDPTAVRVEQMIADR